MQPDSIIGGRFELKAMLGQGGMGTVYEGIDRQTGQKVAVKSLKPELIASEPSMVERFEREGEALRVLNHPNIVKMLASVTEGDQHYLVMEYVQGGSLEALIRTDALLPIDRVLDIALDLTEALTRAHRLKIIHRDIKPANVLIAEDGTPRLSDFGVARLGDKQRMTQTGYAVGTFAYLAPEILGGQSADARSDIWAFGVMLFEMLTGRLPFTGDSTAALLTSIITQDAPDALEYRSDVPPGLNDLIHRMLDKNPDTRLDSIRMVGAQLEAIKAGKLTPSGGVQVVVTDMPATPSPTQALRADLDGPTFTPTPVSAHLTPASGSAPPTPAPELAGASVAGGAASRALLARAPLVLGALVSVVVIVALAFVLSGGLGGTASAPTGTPAVVPVQPGEVMVLVAAFERLGGDVSDVQRFIADNLREVLEVGVPFSRIRVRTTTEIITSDEQARALANAVNAPVIVWGSYDAGGVEVNVQVGSLADYPGATAFARDLIDRTLNVRLQVDNPRRQSVARHVVNVLAGITNFGGDMHSTSTWVTVNGMLNVEMPVELGTGTAVLVHQALNTYGQDSAFALLDRAIAADTGNPGPYITRGSMLFVRGALDDVERDMLTATRLAPPGWVTPIVALSMVELGRGSHDGAMDYINRALELRPQDWFNVYLRGSYFYLKGDYTAARTDMERAVTGATANYPYAFLTALALRDGRISDASVLMRDSLVRFPDPTFGNRMVSTIFGAAGNSVMPIDYGATLGAFNAVALGQYQDALRYVDLALQTGTFADTYFLKGFTQCNLRDYAGAYDSYTRAIELAPDVPVYYMLRAETLIMQGDLLGGLGDIQTAQGMDTFTDELRVLAEKGVTREVTCENFFNPYTMPVTPAPSGGAATP